MRVDSIPAEISKPAEECGMPREIVYPAPEYPAMTPETPAVPPECDTGGRQTGLRRGNTPRASRLEAEKDARAAAEAESSAKRERRKRMQLLRTFVAPVAATIATVAVVFASFGYDPLGGSTGTGLYADAESGEKPGGSPGGKGSDSDAKAPTGTATPTIAITTPIPGPVTPTPELLHGSEGAMSYAVPVTWTMIHVEAPNGVVFDTSMTDGDPMPEALSWVASWGGSSDLTQTDKKRMFLGYMLSDDAIPIGDMDYLDNLYLAAGTIYAVYREDIYYKAGFGSGTPAASPTPTPVTPPFVDTSFPTLPNPDPDTAGNYAWNPNGDPEQFICILGTDDSYSYLVSGAAIGAPITEYPGAEYDASTNTLTLTNCTIQMIEVNLMGNSFTINLVGDNRIGQLRMWGAMYAGSVTLTGTGTLKVNEDRGYPIGIIVNGEVSPSALLVDRGIQVDVYGDVAIIVGATSLEKGIYCRTGVVMTGGECRSGEYSQYITTYVTLADQYSGSSEPLYDYAVVDDSGVPVNEVHFTDPDR